MPGWNGSRRRDELPPNWGQLKKQAKARAGGRCERKTNGVRCDRAGKELHHIKRDVHDLRWLEWLCPEHHRIETIKQAKAAQRAKYQAARYRQLEAHPGAPSDALPWLRGRN